LQEPKPAEGGQLDKSGIGKKKKRKETRKRITFFTGGGGGGGMGRGSGTPKNKRTIGYTEEKGKELDLGGEGGKSRRRCGRRANNKNI